jgi:hypothetical protein
MPDALVGWNTTFVAELLSSRFADHCAAVIAASPIKALDIYRGRGRLAPLGMVTSRAYATSALPWTDRAIKKRLNWSWRRSRRLGSVSRDHRIRDLKLSSFGFIVTIYGEDRLRPAATMPLSTPAKAFEEARKKKDNRVDVPRK